MSNLRSLSLIASIAHSFVAVSASAEPGGGAAAFGTTSVDKRPPGPAGERGASAAGVADAGLLLPSVMAPSIHHGAAFGAVRSGYDGSSDAFVARAVAEASLTSYLALRLDFEHGPSMGPDNHLRIGGRLQLLRDEDHGFDGAVALFYDANEFREEGNIVAGLLASKRLGRIGIFGNLLFGSDPEGDDQVLEARLGGMYRVASSFELGVDARGRYNLSSDEKRAGTLTRDWELHALPTASLALGSFALVAEAGLSAQRTTGPFGQPSEVTETRAGLLAMAGAAGAF